MRFVVCVPVYAWHTLWENGLSLLTHPPTHSLYNQAAAWWVRRCLVACTTSSPSTTWCSPAASSSPGFPRYVGWVGGWVGGK